MTRETTDDGAFDPVCRRPEGLVHAVRAGRSAADGLTWRVANGPHWERVGKGLYVPRDRPRVVEQRVVDAAARLPVDGSRGFVTGWAALRWHGASYFDGSRPDGRPAPVELAIHHDTSLAPRPGTVVRRAEVGPRERVTVAGVPVATPARALLDEIRTRDALWPAVQAIDMTAAARLLSVWLFAEFLWWCHTRTRVGLARHAASLAVDESRSPRETWLRLVWELVAGLPTPEVNRPVYDLGGRLIGVPDLFDPVAGLVGEYAGAVHRSRDRHRRDRVREERFRDHGLEYAEIVAGDSRSAAAGRLLGARRRAAFLPPDRRAWTLERPAWDPAPETLDDYFERTGQAAVIRACEYAPPDPDPGTWIPGRRPEAI